MNKKLAISAIVLVAVVMSMSTLTPAIAEPGNPKSKATTEICHYAEAEPIFDEGGNQIGEEPAHWMFLFVSGNGALKGHIDRHGDGTTSDFKIVNEDTRDQCENLVNPPTA